jgi:hypothetical protein
MKNNRTHPPERLLAAQDARLFDMFDGALAPEPPASVAATHDFLSMCCRPGDTPGTVMPPVSFRSAA